MDVTSAMKLTSSRGASPIVPETSILPLNDITTEPYANKDVIENKDGVSDEKDFLEQTSNQNAAPLGYSCDWLKTQEGAPVSEAVASGMKAAPLPSIAGVLCTDRPDVKCTSQPEVDTDLGCTETLNYLTPPIPFQHAKNTSTVGGGGCSVAKLEQTLPTQSLPKQENTAKPLDTNSTPSAPSLPQPQTPEPQSSTETELEKSMVAAASEEQPMEAETTNSTVSITQHAMSASSYDTASQRDEAMEVSSGCVEHVVCTTDGLSDKQGGFSCAPNSHLVEGHSSASECVEKQALDKDSKSFGQQTNVKAGSMEATDNPDSQMQVDDSTLEADSQTTKPIDGETTSSLQIASCVSKSEEHMETKCAPEPHSQVESEASHRGTQSACKLQAECSDSVQAKERNSEPNIQDTGKTKGESSSSESNSHLNNNNNTITKSGGTKVTNSKPNSKDTKRAESKAKSTGSSDPSASEQTNAKQTSFASTTQEHLGSKFQRRYNEQTKGEVPAPKRKLKPKKNVVTHKLSSTSVPAAPADSNDTLKLRKGSQSLSEMIQQLLVQQSKLIEKRITEKKQNILQQQMLMRSADGPLILSKKRRIEEATSELLSFNRSVASSMTSQAGGSGDGSNSSSALSILSETAEAIGIKIDALQKLLPANAGNPPAEQLSMENVTSKISELFPNLGFLPMATALAGSQSPLISQLHPGPSDAALLQSVVRPPPPLLKVAPNATPAPTSSSAPPLLSAATISPPPSPPPPPPPPPPRPPPSATSNTGTAFDQSSSQTQRNSVEESSSARTRAVVNTSSAQPAFSAEGNLESSNTHAALSERKAKSTVVVTSVPSASRSSQVTPATNSVSTGTYTTSSKRKLFNSDAQTQTSAKPSPTKKATPLHSQEPTTSLQSQTPPLSSMSSTNATPHSHNPQWIDLSSSSQDSISAHSKIRVSMLPNNQSSDITVAADPSMDTQAAGIANLDSTLVTASAPQDALAKKASKRKRRRNKNTTFKAPALSHSPHLLVPSSDTAPVVYAQTVSGAEVSARKVSCTPTSLSSSATGSSTLAAAAAPPPKLKPDLSREVKPPELIPTSGGDRSLSTFTAQMQNQIQQAISGSAKIRNFYPAMTNEPTVTDGSGVTTAVCSHRLIAAKPLLAPLQAATHASSGVSKLSGYNSATNLPAANLKYPGRVTVTVVGNKGEHTPNATPPVFASAQRRTIAPKPPPMHDWPLRSRSRGVTVTVTNTFHPVNPLLDAKKEGEYTPTQYFEKGKLLQRANRSRGNAANLEELTGPSAKKAKYRHKICDYNVIIDEMLRDSELSDDGDDDDGMLTEGNEPLPPSDSGDKGQQSTSGKHPPIEHFALL